MINRIVELAQDFIKIPSVTGDIEKSVEILQTAQQMLTGYEFTSFVSGQYPSLLYSNQNKDNHKFSVILNIHLDVVPGKPSQFHPFIQEDKLYGRGAYDMKAAAAVLLLLFKDVGKKVSYPLGLQITTDEETGGINGTKYQVDNGVRADFFITGEGSNFRMIYETKGVMVAKLITKGLAAHSAYPWNGQNAILLMYESLDILMKHYPVPVSETEVTTINISRIETTNTAHNKIPDNCMAYLDIRFDPREDDTIVSHIKSLLPEHVEMEILEKTHVHCTSPKSSFISLMRKSAIDAANIDVPLGKGHGASDARYFSHVGCDAIEFGPLGKGQHEDDEWVDISSLENYYKILHNFLLSLQDTYLGSK